MCKAPGARRIPEASKSPTMGRAAASFFLLRCRVGFPTECRNSERFFELGG